MPPPRDLQLAGHGSGDQRLPPLGEEIDLFRQPLNHAFDLCA
jgi:hypothetical protein